MNIKQVKTRGGELQRIKIDRLKTKDSLWSQR
jgi:hypothetical protein